MSETVTKEIYSEVFSVLNLLGDDYIKKLPTKLYSMIKEEKLNTYNPKYVAEKTLVEQNIKKESLSMIALFHLNYWCTSEEEKENLKKIFENNERKYQEELTNKYNPNNIFKNKTQEIKKIELNTDEKSIKPYKENIFKKIFHKIFNKRI